MFFNKKNREQALRSHPQPQPPPSAEASPDLGLPIVRPMTEDDLPEVTAIENQSFSSPWTTEAFQSELRNNVLAYYNCLVFQGQIIGYMGYWSIFGEAHVTNMAIHPDYRHWGWGEYFFRSVMKQCVNSGIERMTLEVRASNLAAQNMYTKLGFRSVGRRKKYYSDNQEDALIMWVSL